MRPSPAPDQETCQRLWPGGRHHVTAHMHPEENDVVDAVETVTLRKPSMSPTPNAVATAARQRSPLPRDFEVAIAPDRSRLAQVRCIAAAYLRYCSVPESLADDVVLVVSELVANAVEHGQGTVGLRLRHTLEEARVEVTDGSPAPARLRAASPEDEHGRGLLLVSVLASAWGVSDDGRTTWATFRVAAGRP
ncbi:hypothetical protein GCM10023336_38510 [Streptomyces similanensis]|uniref:Histidine kinase/HSP90-like ATPase domain-containing protein n=2 Tax=Streptomyces similanensis TaxID=1274988 RepID=A0ABP9KLG5_9ACTN